MQPTVGRIVHFYEGTGQDDNANVLTVPAIITRVWNPTCVNLWVFKEAELTFKTSVIQGTQKDHWNWPAIV